MSLAYLVDFDKQWYGAPTPPGRAGFNGNDRKVWAALFYMEDCFFAKEFAEFVSQIFGQDFSANKMAMSLRKLTKLGYVKREKVKTYGYGERFLYEPTASFSLLREMWG